MATPAARETVTKHNSAVNPDRFAHSGIANIIQKEMQLANKSIYIGNRLPNNKKIYRQNYKIKPPKENEF